MLSECSWLTGQTVEDVGKDRLENEHFPLVCPEEDGEVRSHVHSCKTVVEEKALLGTDRFSRFSDWERLVKTVSLLMHIARASKSDVE